MSMINQEKVLVLNRWHTPIRVISLRRAIPMLAKERAVVIDMASDNRYAEVGWDEWVACETKGDEPSISCIRKNIRIPRVIRLTSYDRVPHRQIKFNRSRIFQRDKYTCQYCGRQPGVQHLNLDHVKPRCLGGQSSWENVVCACIDCNTKKADKTLEQCGFRLRRQPFKPTFQVLTENVRVDCWQAYLGKDYWESLNADDF